MDKRVLVIDDERNMCHMLMAMLTAHGYQVDSVEDGVQGLAALAQEDYDFVLCDIRMPKMDGMAFLSRARSLSVDITIIMMSAFGTVDIAIEAMKQGAYDYISKPFKADEVLLVLAKAAEREALREENTRLRHQLLQSEDGGGLDGMVGKSKAMQSVFAMAKKVARYNTTVLVTGESGTGKELVAKGIHKESPRAGKPFIAINCGGIPENLVESELFGYVKGAFTGAERDKKGLFEEADQGTLFLDEIGELPLALQVKILRVLQEQEVRQLGASRTVKIDVRVIAATARELSKEIELGCFRKDLFYRLNVVNIEIPPLRERPEDIGHLCRYFITKIAEHLEVPIEGVSPVAMNLLLQYPWPGNVREVENVMERAVVLAEKKVLLPENLPENLGNKGQCRRLDDVLGTLSIKQGQKILERRLISRALEATAGNKSRACDLLEISYPSLLNKIKEYGV